jgi:hypothetical protein
MSFGGVGLGAQHHPAQELGRHEVDQMKRYRRIMPFVGWRRSSRSRAVCTVSGTHKLNVCGRRRAAEHHQLGEEHRLRIMQRRRSDTAMMMPAAWNPIVAGHELKPTYRTSQAHPPSPPPTRYGHSHEIRHLALLGALPAAMIARSSEHPRLLL